jgi:hypothetical protein
VQTGEAVTAGTVIGQVYDGPEGIETGWADRTADGATMAAVNGQFGGSDTTAFGAKFSAMLQSLGPPGGTAQNAPAASGLPSG